LFVMTGAAGGAELLGVIAALGCGARPPNCGEAAFVGAAGGANGDDCANCEVTG
jgi:hypothetical protein